MNIIIPVIGVSAVVSIAVCFAILCIKDAFGVGVDISKKLAFKSVKIAPEGNALVYHFDRSDFENGLCTEEEIGELVDNETLAERYRTRGQKTGKYVPAKCR